MLDISVVIPAYNEEKYILNSLKSLINQSMATKINYEVIIVDNNSEDRTKEKVCEFINYFNNKKKIESSNVEFLLIEEPRRGVAFARETGFRKARGKIIATTDADCIVSPLWIRTIYNIFKYNYDYLYYQFLQNFPRKIRKRIINNVNKPIVAATGLIKFYDDDTYELKVINKLIPVFLGLGNFFWLFPALHGSNFAVRKDYFEIVGGFNTNLKTGEDLDLGVKLSKYGRIVFLPSIVYSSSRRFRKNLLKAVLIYTFGNFLSHRIFGKPMINELDLARGERDILYPDKIKQKIKEIVEELKEKLSNNHLRK
ncbi:MAG: glycosyltransferase [Candidatus Calescibacterium sp.]|nr:glycosyltransferase [Candidatus Calescibacterium sp.]MCX7972146.1 glycosyltransferase [bacterium]MDW8194835.1 glycosyltransferase [Candidatus Calescibacterium sp.]